MPLYWGPETWATRQPDTGLGDLDDPQTLNLYSYVRNSPTFLTDSTGQNIDPEDFNCNEGICHSQDGGLSDHGAPLDLKDKNSLKPDAIVTATPLDDPCERLCQATFHSAYAQRTWQISASVGNDLGWATLAVTVANVSVMAIGPITDVVAAVRYTRALQAFKALTKGTGTAKLLEQFFKTGKLPPGLTPEALKSYLELAKAYVAAGMGGLGGGGVEGSAVQTQRIQQIEQFLEK